jgi:hypothetical protein
MNALITNFAFNNSNKDEIEIKLECNHKKVCKIGSIYQCKKTCLICKNVEKFNYNIETKEKTCEKCKFVHKDIPSSNLLKFNCWNCDAPKKPDTKLLKMMSDNGFQVNKNYRYFSVEGKKTNKTGDLYFVDEEENVIVIEIDDASHLSEKSKSSHLEKDNLILVRNKTKLIRLHRDDIDDFVNNIDEILNKLKDRIIIVYQPTKNTKKFYEKLYGYEEQRFIYFMDPIEKEEKEEEKEEEEEQEEQEEESELDRLEKELLKLNKDLWKLKHQRELLQFRQGLWNEEEPVGFDEEVNKQKIEKQMKKIQEKEQEIEKKMKE